MNKFEIQVGLDLEKIMTDLCRTSGSHLTVCSDGKRLVFASVIPECFKAYRLPCEVCIEPFSVRLPKKIMNPIISAGTTLLFELGDSITICKLRDSHMLSSVRMPLEQDFNSEFVFSALCAREGTDERFDLSAVSDLRPIVNYAQYGLQFRSNLAYILGPGFIVYKEIEHGVDFIMTPSNVTELISFIKSNGNVAVYEQGAYVIFRSSNKWLGCRLPVRFVDSEYKTYKQMNPLSEIKINLVELYSTLHGMTLPKNEITKCTFDLSHSVVLIELGAFYHYKVDIQCGSVEGLKFDLPLEVVHKLFTNTRLKYSDITLRVFDSFVAFMTNNTHILINRE